MAVELETWTNWAGNQTCQATIHDVQSLDELSSLIKSIGGKGSIRAAGGGAPPQPSNVASFSYSPIARNDGQHIVRLHALNHVGPGSAPGTLVAQPGATTLDASRGAQAAGLSFRTMTLIPWVTIGGATAVGANGQGWNEGTLSDQILSLDLMTATGNVMTVTRGTDLWKAASVGLGMLGIVTSVTFECLPRFKLHSLDRKIPMDDLLNDMQEIVEQNDYAEISWFPYNALGWAKTWNRVPWSTPNKGKIENQFWQDLATDAGAFGMDLTVKYPRLTPAFLQLVMDEVTTDGNEIVLPADEIYHWQLDYPKIWDLCYAIPVDDDFANIKAAIRLASKTLCDDAEPVANGSCVSADPYNYSEDGTFPQNLMLNARFLGSSDAYLSSAVRSGHTCYLEVTTSTRNPSYLPYFETLAKGWLQLGGRPHWGKMFGVGTDQLNWSALYGKDLDAFRAIERDMDPQRVFLNEFTRTLMGRTA